MRLFRAGESESLPAHWQRGRRWAVVATLCVIVVVTFALRDFGHADQGDSWWLRMRFGLRERLLPAHKDPEIVLVRLDDRCFDTWPEPTIAWGPHLADAIDRLALSGAKVIALDWTQPAPTDIWFPHNDERLAKALANADRIVWVKLARGSAAGNSWIYPAPVLLYSQPSANGPGGPDAVTGFAELTKDDSVVAAFLPALPTDPSAVSFAARVAERRLGTPGRLTSSEWSVAGRLRVPVRRDGSVLVNYPVGTGTGRAFAAYSLSEVAALPLRPDPRFQDKIVVIGGGFTGDNDQHYVPLPSSLTGTRLVPGTEIQASFIRTLLDGGPLREPGINALWLYAVLLGAAGIAAFLRLPWLMAALATATIGLVWIAVAFGLFVWRDMVLPINLALSGLLLAGGGMGGYLALAEGRERRRVLNLWGRYQQPRIVDYLLCNPEARGGEGREVTVTVLFADLKNFTKTVESLSPTDALHVLNRYLALLAEAILEENGVVDKYLGDGLMAQWGAPAMPGEAVPFDHAAAAVRACRKILQRAETMTTSLALPGSAEVTFGLRLTLHTGPVVLGWVGAGRLEFTIIGDTVNVTSRLQETAKQLECEFLISDTTYAGVQGSVRTGKVAEVEIRGRKQPLRVYEVLD